MYKNPSDAVKAPTICLNNVTSFLVSTQLPIALFAPWLNLPEPAVLLHSRDTSILELVSHWL
jgi:hypothetical protein